MPKWQLLKSIHNPLLFKKNIHKQLKMQAQENNMKHILNSKQYKEYLSFDKKHWIYLRYHESLLTFKNAISQLQLQVQ